MKNKLKNKILHVPGQTLHEKLIDSIYEGPIQYLMMISFIVVVVIIQWINFYLNTKTSPIFLTVLGGIFILFFLYKIKKSLTEIKNIKQGLEGEREVGQGLEDLRSDGCLIFHDVQGPDFNIDHVVISPKGIFTVETKKLTKKNPKEIIKFSENKLIINGHYSGEIISQVNAQADWLMGILKASTGKNLKIQPVVVFPGWFVDPLSSNKAQEKGIWLLNPKALPEYIKNNPIVLSDEDLHLFSFHLERYIKST